MNEELRALILELGSIGESIDASQTDRSQKMLNITHDTGEFLSVLIRAIDAKSILEIGTSNGYSTLWLAFAAEATDGHVVTVEKSQFKIDLAAKNFARSGLSPRITQVTQDATDYLQGLANESVDLLFLDSERSEYVAWLPSLKRILKKGGLLVVDNAISHESEMKTFTDLMKKDADFETSLVPVGKGEFMAVKAT